jgi:diguanylate cyclase (GGDEF)-like protein/PAS domain S-box-containing protein
MEGSDAKRPPLAVLIVNDREDQRVAIRTMLAPLDLAVVEADSGRDALRAVLRQTFALILMDVRMPTMDGYETANLIRQREQSNKTPIIFITAHAREDVETLTAYASGAVDFIVTPVVPEVLRAKVSIFVGLFAQSEELQRSVQALRDTEASSRVVLDNVADGIVTADESGLIESANRSAQALFGYREEELIGQPFTVLIALTRRDEFRGLERRPAGLLAEGDRPLRATETFGCREDGSTFAMEVEHCEVNLRGGGSWLAFVRDISERKAYTAGLEHQALHDELTGLANRTLFGVHVLQALASAKRTSEPRAVLVLDLDGFKRVNDAFGHDHGDSLLKQVSERLLATLRDADIVARLGGDEFAILPADATDLPAAAAVAWKLQQTCTPVFLVGAEAVQVTASVGIAMFPEHGRSTVELLGRADAAMYTAKRSGSGQAVFSAEQETQAAQQLALLVDLRQCINRDELVLHYQPKINLRTRKLTGVEALLRWHHPVHGLLTPDSFIANVEHTELITPVTRWVLDNALRQQMTWRDHGNDLTMAVNISARSLRRGSDLPGTVAELTQKWSTPPDRLTLELTEGALIEAAAPDVLGRLHNMGQRMSIDDYGTGYSSLAYLQRLPVDELKIDRTFTSSLAAASDDEVIVRSTIDLAHNLGLTVVAEGVENEHVLRMLTEHHCDAAQGYFFSRPRPADELTTWITQSPYGTPTR